MIQNALLSLLCVGLSLFVNANAAEAESPIGAFSATSLSGQKVSEQDLLGEGSILIVTPSRDAAGDTRAWVSALQKRVDTKSRRVRDVICIDLPFFMTERDALAMAKKKIPERFHDQTWLLASTVLEDSLSVPASSSDAFVFVFDAEGTIAARVRGAPSEKRIQQLNNALSSLPH